MEKQQKILNKISKESKILAFNPLTEKLVRVGYGTRGLIYGTMGLLALLIAVGFSGSLRDQQGAIASIGQLPIGRILLGAMLIGLVGYCLWGLIRAFLDPLHKGTKVVGLFERAGYLVSAVGYSSLIFPTYNVIFSNSNAAQNGAQGVLIRSWIGTILSIPYGKWIVGIAGLIIMGAGALQGYQGLRRHFDQHIKPIGLTAKQGRLVKILGRFGYLGRGVVFLILGLFLLSAAYQGNSADAKGIDGALLSLLQQPYGHWLLGIVALSLIAFGGYSVLNAFWFRFKSQ